LKGSGKGEKGAFFNSKGKGPGKGNSKGKGGFNHGKGKNSGKGKGWGDAAKERRSAAKQTGPSQRYSKAMRKISERSQNQKFQTQSVRNISKILKQSGGKTISITFSSDGGKGDGKGGKGGGKGSQESRLRTHMRVGPKERS